MKEKKGKERKGKEKEFNTVVFFIQKS